ncbi:MAG: CoA-binding protein [Thermoanaerobaculia bacterium]|nr:CoA-binding protein [Thermoanaerobaculia bacterium]
MSDPITDFLALKRIAIAGVSRSRDQPANLNYRRLRELGYEVVAVNPRADVVEGDRCFPDLASIPGGVEGVLAFTAPDDTNQIARQCIDLGIKHLWMHRSFGAGSVSQKAVDLCRQRGIRVIPGGCPMMVLSPVDLGHRCMRWVLRLTGGLPHAA